MITLPTPRKAYVCKACQHTMFDVCVTSCDCMPDVDEFEEVNYYTESQLYQALNHLLDEAINIRDNAHILREYLK